MTTNNSPDLEQKFNNETHQDNAEKLHPSNPAQPEQTLKFKGLFRSPLRIFIFMQAVICLIYVTGITAFYYMLINTQAHPDFDDIPGIEMLSLFLVITSAAPFFAFCTFTSIVALCLYKKCGSTPINTEVMPLFIKSLTMNTAKNIGLPITYKSLLIFSVAVSGGLGGLISICTALVMLGPGYVVHIMDATGGLIVTTAMFFGQGFWLPVILQIISFTQPSLTTIKKLNVISIGCCILLMPFFVPCNAIILTTFWILFR